jgi:chromosome partitioning protein
MPKNIIAVLNQKGGVGKTTTCINLAAYLAKNGSKVLICDIDPQGNSTSGLGINKHELSSTLYDVLFSRAEGHNVIQKTNLNNVFLLPSNASLASAEVELVPLENRETQLKRALSGLDYDFVLSVIQQVKKSLNPDLAILGVVITLYDSRNSLSEQVKKELHNFFGDKVFESVIPRNVRLAEAPSFGKAIIEHDKWSKGARAYKALAKEVEKRVTV